MISILTVLEVIKDSNTETGLHPFSIRYVKQNGDVGIKHKVVQNSKALNYRHQPTAVPDAPSGLKTSLKETANLMLYDIVQQQPFNIPFYALIEFNGIQIHHE